MRDMDRDLGSCLDELKKDYVVFRKKYNMVEFSELNKVFDIEDVDVDSDFLLRKIRRVIAERIAGYLRFIEIILNPANTPIFFFKLVKKLDSEDRKVLGEIYEKLGSIEVEVVELDLKYDEKKEAEFIMKIYNLFGDFSDKLLGVVKKLGNGGSLQKSVNNGSYFG